eukprot:CAMPEP_0181487366 /NCGR_PEP_ID=MMETSP1110-20121109/47772_1 /TAXON_ID=174948 /ORGANISM="Symbiodinium sp., Strain CCMP421" /LENGTH=173 /DNA_ID=CAMNT_0023613851 /DNA_START=51 /DNA_END=572 /DNA_ORIENTATION=+
MPRSAASAIRPFSVQWLGGATGVRAYLRKAARSGCFCTPRVPTSAANFSRRELRASSSKHRMAPKDVVNTSICSQASKLHHAAPTATTIDHSLQLDELLQSPSVSSGMLAVRTCTSFVRAASDSSKSPSCSALLQGARAAPESHPEALYLDRAHLGTAVPMSMDRQAVWQAIQ